MSDEKIALFDYVKSIRYKRQPAHVRHLSENPNLDSDYQSFIVNRALSFYEDTVLPANLMNERPELPKLLQYRFLINIIRPCYQYSEWLKDVKATDAERTIAEYYAVSLRYARKMVSLHSSAQLDEMRRRLERGGVHKGSHHDDNTPVGKGTTTIHR